MSKYEDAWGTVMTEDEAKEDLNEKMEISDYLYYLPISFDKILEWCFTQQGFYEQFYDALTSAENEYFIEHYTEIEDEEDDEQSSFFFVYYLPAVESPGRSPGRDTDSPFHYTTGLDYVQVFFMSNL